MTLFCRCLLLRRVILSWGSAEEFNQTFDLTSVVMMQRFLRIVTSKRAGGHESGTNERIRKSDIDEMKIGYRREYY